MALIFISHSSQNNEQAIQLRDWLVANGWDDIFLDLDPERGIAAGERWREALQKAAQRCEAVIALISHEWLASDWCRPELNTAQLMGKKIIVLLIGSKPSEIPGDLKDAQYVDLINDPDAYARLKVGLKRAGLDPASFPFAEGRRPYPGFAPLEEDDAAIFYGRDAQIVRGLDKLRGLTRAGVERMLIILGASGCGKSSFLRAGLWPRLKRDDSTWLPLPTIRPERAVIAGKFGLVDALYRIMNEAPFVEKLQNQELPRSRADIEEFVTTGDDGLLKILAALREAGHVPGLSGEETPPSTIVIPIDQGEELFNEDGRAEAKRFIDILTKTLAADPHLLALFTMRTDSFPQFQSDPQLATVPKDTFTLDMMLEGSYREIIEGPAALVKPKPLKIDPQLTEALLQDAAGQDALPLLAFTLRYLYDQYQANNELSLGSYEKLGRLKGVMETTVKQALAEGVAEGELPKDDKAQLALIRKAFIPLARVNAAGQFARRIATRAEIPPDAQPVIDCLTEARLLIKDRRTVGEQDVEVIEVAHEALLREWKDLHDALLEEREFLIAKGQLDQDVADWQATPEGRKSGALLTGNKLDRARHWLIQRPQDLTPEERRFIQASADAEAARRRWRQMAAAAAFIVITAFAVFAGWQWWVAGTQRDRAERSLNLATQTANGLIFDLAQKFRNVAGVPSTLIKDILDRALKLQAQLIGSGEASPELRRNQSVGLTESARTLLTLGNTGGALAAAKQAQAIIQSLLTIEPNNTPWQSDLLVSDSMIGDVLLAQGKRDEALAAYRDGLAIGKALVAKDASNTEWLRGLASSDERIGIVLKAQGKRNEALAAYRDSLAIAKALVAKDPSNTLWQRDLAANDNNIGDLLKAQDKPDEALAAYRDSLAIVKALVAKDPSNTDWQSDLLVSDSMIGDVLLVQGKRDEALAAYRDSLATAKALVAKDPSNALWQSDLSINDNKIGFVLKAQGRLDEALAAHRDGLAIAKALVAKDPSNTLWQSDLWVSDNNIGDVLKAQGKLDEALAAYRDGLAIAKALVAKDPSNTQWQLDLALGHVNRGRIYWQKGDLDKALADLEAALRIAPDDIDALSDHAGVLDDKGDYDGAIVDFDKVLAAQPDNADALNDRAWAYGQKGDLERALPDANRAVSLNPTDPNILETRGWIYIAKGEPDLALADLDKALSIDPEFVDVYADRGRAYELKGDRDKAIADYRKVLSLKSKSTNNDKAKAEALQHLTALGAVNTRRDGADVGP
jgi:tetratricopeptide (TPR) repeat protein